MTFPPGFKPAPPTEAERQTAELERKLFEQAGLPPPKPRPTITPRDDIQHLDGIPWHDAPVPSRWHRCQPQTMGYLNYFTLIERCACGALRRDRDHLGWTDKNSRSKPAR